MAEIINSAICTQKTSMTMCDVMCTSASLKSHEKIKPLADCSAERHSQSLGSCSLVELVLRKASSV